MNLKFYFSTLVFVLLAAQAVKAQTVCNGESVRFIETFGAGNNSASLPNGVTTYSYNNNGNLTDGEYRLSKSSQGRSEWHNSGDHTGNNNGRMMVINAGYTPGEFYRDTVNGLTPGANYSVSLFIMNVNTLGTCGAGAILPKLQFVVEYLAANNTYQTLASFNSNFIPQTSTPTWVKLSSGFTLPNGITTVRYKIINNSAGGCGNDLALDDITFSQCASLSALPVKGLKINNVHEKADGVYVNFSTEAEYDTKSMETQRSMDGINWKTIHTQAAAGNSDRYKAYIAADAEKFEQAVYYRILQTDINGSFTFSTVVKYQPSANAGISLSTYPNPAQQEVNLNINSPSNGTAVISLFAVNGALVQRQHVQMRKGSNVVKLDLSKMAKGLYNIVLENADHSKLTQKLVKQ